MEEVSVPLRGLDIRKHKNNVKGYELKVSVPLRGLDIRKRQCQMSDLFAIYRFSPLAGIRYTETLALTSTATR